MSVKKKIISGEGRPLAVGVTDDQALKTAQLPLRRVGLSAQLLTAEKLYREWFTAAGSNAMNTLGTLFSPVRFTVISKTDRYLAVHGVRLLLESANMDVSGVELRRFGAASTGALTNGLQLLAVQGGVSTPLFVDPVQVVSDFFSYTETYFTRVDGVAPGVDILNLRIEFDVPVVIPAGSADRLEFVVRDDLRQIASFKTLVFGTQELVIS